MSSHAPYLCKPHIGCPWRAWRWHVLFFFKLLKKELQSAAILSTGNSGNLENREQRKAGLGGQGKILGLLVWPQGLAAARIFIHLLNTLSEHLPCVFVQGAGHPEMTEMWSCSQRSRMPQADGLNRRNKMVHSLNPTEVFTGVSGSKGLDGWAFPWGVNWKCFPRMLVLKAVDQGRPGGGTGRERRHQAEDAACANTQTSAGMATRTQDAQAFLSPRAMAGRDARKRFRLEVRCSVKRTSTHRAHCTTPPANVQLGRTVEVSGFQASGAGG